MSLENFFSANTARLVRFVRVGQNPETVCPVNSVHGCVEHRVDSGVQIVVIDDFLRGWYANTDASKMERVSLERRCAMP